MKVSLSLIMVALIASMSGAIFAATIKNTSGAPLTVRGGYGVEDEVGETFTLPVGAEISFDPHKVVDGKKEKLQVFTFPGSDREAISLQKENVTTFSQEVE